MVAWLMGQGIEAIGYWTNNCRRLAAVDTSKYLAIVGRHRLMVGTLPQCLAIVCWVWFELG